MYKTVTTKLFYSFFIYLLAFNVFLLRPDKAIAISAPSPITRTIVVTGNIDSAITFSLYSGRTAMGFGSLSTTQLKYATGSGGSAGTGSTSVPAAASTAGFSVSSNATNGVLVTVVDAYSGLRDTARNKTISAVGANGTAAGEKYFVYGRIDSGTGLTIDEGFDNDATSPVALSTTTANFASSSGPIDQNDVSLILGAGATTLTTAGDYADTITIICTNRF